MADKRAMEEWLESPITRFVRTMIERRLDTAYHNRGDLYLWGEPVKTQEQRAYLMGAEAELDTIAEFLKTGEMSLLETPESKDEQESVRDNPEGGEGTGEAGYH